MTEMICWAMATTITKHMHACRSMEYQVALRGWAYGDEVNISRVMNAGLWIM